MDEKEVSKYLKLKIKKFVRNFVKYDAKSYWLKRGKTLYSDNPYSKKEYELQMNEVLDYLKTLEFSSVLEYGCGYGRYTKLLLQNFKIKSYVATELSQDSIKEAKKLNQEFDNVEFKTTTIQDLNFDEKFDLVLGTEVLQHVKEEEIKTCINKLVNLSKKHIVNIDSYFDVKPEYLARHCFNHNYEVLYSKNENVKEVKRIKLSVFNHSLYHIIVK